MYVEHHVFRQYIRPADKFHQFERRKFFIEMDVISESSFWVQFEKIQIFDTG